MNIKEEDRKKEVKKERNRERKKESSSGQQVRAMISVKTPDVDSALLESIVQRTPVNLLKRGSGRRL